MVGFILKAIPSLGALLGLEELSADDLSQSSKNGDLSEVVVIRPDIVEYKSSSFLDESALEDTRAALSAHSGSSILKNHHDPFYPLVKGFRAWCATNHPLFYLQVEVSAIKLHLTWFLGANVVSHDSGPYQRNNVMSLTISSMQNTRQKWYVRVNLRSRHRHFCQKAEQYGVLYMLITSLMRSHYSIVKYVNYFK